MNERIKKLIDRLETDSYKTSIGKQACKEYLENLDIDKFCIPVHPVYNLDYGDGVLGHCGWWWYSDVAYITATYNENGKFDLYLAIRHNDCDYKFIDDIEDLNDYNSEIKLLLEKGIIK